MPYTTSKHLQPLLSYIKLFYPQAYEKILDQKLISENLFSPFLLELPQSICQQVESFVAEIYRLKETPEYQNQLRDVADISHWPKNKSILSCFDFHYSQEQGLKLIEINTNASLYLPIILQRCAQAKQCKPPQFEKLYASFQEAFDLQPGSAISVFDENPEKEGLFFEFLIFKEWLEKKGHPTNIISLENFSEESHDNIYNRYTDFYFQEDKSAAVRKAYFEKTKKFSPNPREYFLMADKQRLSLLRSHLSLTHPDLARLIPESRPFADFDGPEDIWQQRKNYFFKPSTSFGSKGAFAGKNISRKAFDRLYAPDILAQEYCPAGKRRFQWEDEEIEMKFDLRFFTFNGEVQNYGARLYQGQTTNMKTPMGGLAPIVFS